MVVLHLLINRLEIYFLFTVNPGLDLATSHIASRFLVKLIFSSMFFRKELKFFFRQNLIIVFEFKFKSEVLNPLFSSYNTLGKCWGYSCTPPPKVPDMILK